MFEWLGAGIRRGIGKLREIWLWIFVVAYFRMGFEKESSIWFASFFFFFFEHAHTNTYTKYFEIHMEQAEFLHAEGFGRGRREQNLRGFKSANSVVFLLALSLFAVAAVVDLD